MLNVIQIPALNDNYVYVLHDQIEDVVAVVDPSVAEPVIEVLEDRGLKPDFILNTHHHNDHIGGNDALVQKYGCEIIAPKGEVRIPNVDRRVAEGDRVKIGASTAQVFETPGHTTHHIVYYFETDTALFCGDTLFSIGCGRLFEGTPEQMFKSLSKIKALPDDTRVFCAHEYTKANIAFAKTVLKGNEALESYETQVLSLRARGESTIPSILKVEKQANPFLRAETVQEFADYRKAKDAF